jgi:hypothetical protein
MTLDLRDANALHTGLDEQRDPTRAIMMLQIRIMLRYSISRIG